MSVVTLSILTRRKRAPKESPPRLPSWSETASRRDRARPSPTVAAVLRDLVSWAADIAVVLTRGCPEDRSAIERVRSYALAWLAGERCPDIEIDDVLTTAAALMAEIDRDIGRADGEDDDHDAIGATVRRE